MLASVPSPLRESLLTAAVRLRASTRRLATRRPLSTSALMLRHHANCTTALAKSLALVRFQVYSKPNPGWLNWRAMIIEQFS